MVVEAGVLNAVIQYVLLFLVVLAVVDLQVVLKQHLELQTLAAAVAVAVTAEVQDKHARAVTAVKAL
jgi:Flp pilus assembly protein TadG